jgi:hypothetical protein
MAPGLLLAHAPWADGHLEQHSWTPERHSRAIPRTGPFQSSQRTSPIRSGQYKLLPWLTGAESSQNKAFSKECEAGLVAIALVFQSANEVVAEVPATYFQGLNQADIVGKPYQDDENHKLYSKPTPVSGSTATGYSKIPIPTHVK